MNRRDFLQSASMAVMVPLVPALRAPLPAMTTDPALMQMTAIVRAFTEPLERSLIGIDYADYRTVFRGMGRGGFAQASATGAGRATRAAELALSRLGLR